MTSFEDGIEQAQKLDRDDPLALYRDRFHVPEHRDGKKAIYFSGNSLGLQPKSVKEIVHREIEDWAALGVRGHLEARSRWLPYHELLTEQMAKVVGAKPIEVVVMNTLTVNLHLMMVSFYRPTKERFKILVEESVFPSDRYAVQSHIRFHGFDPKRALVVANQEEIESVIEQEGDSIALIMIGAVNYYSGRLFNMDSITKLGHSKGCIVGFDCAHAAGNVPMKLHDWNIDFAVWCNYKYLNSGPGSLAGCFVHEEHAKRFDLPRFAGWWGHDKKTRFLMDPDFVPIEGAEGWQISNPPILSMAAVRASLEVFDEVGMEKLREKSKKLTAYLEFLLTKNENVSLVTPSDPEKRGAQLSLRLVKNGKETFERLRAQGVICDWREPDVIRMAPVPLYNSFEDVFRFSTVFNQES